MNRERPTAVLVMAILNFVMGGLGLITFLCCGLGGLLFTGLMLDFVGKAAPPSKGGPDPSELTKMFDYVPGYYPVTIAHSLLCAGLCVLLIVAGIGLLNMRSWARYTSVAVSLTYIFLALVNIIYTVAIVQPGLEKWQRDMMTKVGAPVMPATSPSSAVNVVAALFGFLINIAYPVALIIVMLLPAVGAAFAAPLLPPEEPPGGGYGGLPPSPGPGSPHVAPRRF